MREEIKRKIYVFLIKLEFVKLVDFNYYKFKELCFEWDFMLIFLIRGFVFVVDFFFFGKYSIYFIVWENVFFFDGRVVL